MGIDIRCGLHTGECELRGDDIGGIAVHIGARIAALAQAREVLVSNTVKDLVNGSGIVFEDRGTHVLKGVPGEWKLFAPVGSNVASDWSRRRCDRCDCRADGPYLTPHWSLSPV
ncbi:adenylate/guanylate cyclase domain-containing protein [Mycobacterium celatum]|uniref:adenylate/guanylate cyclase domain-containing protein n=1 Tax=Mycobacterium celatum TaxID=28045 RepID=UPI00146DB794